MSQSRAGIWLGSSRRDDCGGTGPVCPGYVRPGRCAARGLGGSHPPRKRRRCPTGFMTAVCGIKDQPRPKSRSTWYSRTAVVNFDILNDGFRRQPPHRRAWGESSLRASASRLPAVMPLVNPGRGWVAVLLVAISGCARPDYAETQPDRFFLTAGPQPGYAIKRIVEKQPPITLVGDDGSVCRTSPKRFAGTREGRWIACLWNLPVLDSTQIARR